MYVASRQTPPTTSREATIQFYQIPHEFARKRWSCYTLSFRDFA